MRDDERMRTTLDIDDDVLIAVKEIAQAQQVTAGKVLSTLARKGLETPVPEQQVRNGVPLLPRRPPGAPVLTIELINQLRDDE